MDRLRRNLLPLPPALVATPRTEYLLVDLSLLGLIQFRHPLVKPVRTLFKGLLVQRDTNEVQNPCNSLGLPER